MPTVDEVERQIFKLEGFRAEFRERKKRDWKIHKNHTVLQPYRYPVRAPGNWTFNYWADERFFTKYSNSDFDVRGLDKSGAVRRGNTLLSTLRGE